MTNAAGLPKKLGFPIAEEKIDGPTAVITFLGILLDMIKMELNLPKNKLDDLLLLLKQWTRPKIKKTMKRERAVVISGRSRGIPGSNGSTSLHTRF